MAMSVAYRSFGMTKAGEEVNIYRITNNTEAYVEILNYGCIVKSIYVPDDKGELRNVCLGFDTVAEYENSNLAMGAILGRCAGKFPYTEFTNKVWTVTDSGDNFVLFSRRSTDGEDGLSGNLDLTVRYMWVDYNRLVIDFTAVSDQDMPVNLTSSVYFNLDGESTLAGNKLRMFGDKYAEKGTDGKYTGKLLSLSGTEFESANFKTIADESYDDIYVSDGDNIRPLAELNSMKSNISLSAYTTMPAVHVHTVTEPTAAAAFMEQYIADAADMSELPSITLAAGEEWKQRIIYGFDKVYESQK